MKKNAFKSLALLVAGLVTVSGGLVFAQDTPTSLPVSVVNTSVIKTDAQCNDGP